MPLWLEITLFSLYVLLGPLTWGFMVLSMFEGRRRMRKILQAPPVPEPAPSVTIMIPARNEEANIDKCLAGVFMQDYPNLTVVVANDRSTDDTAKILEQHARSHTNLRVVHLADADFQQGWGGKSSTLYNAYEKGVRSWPSPIGNPQSAVGNSAYLLGLDSDMRLTAPDAVSAMVRAAVKHKAAIVSLLPALESGTFAEGLVIPVTGMLSSAINAVALTNVDSFKKVAYANGQCLLIRRDVYDQIGGHTAVGTIVAEDVALAYAVKGIGQRVRVAWGADRCAVRMYDSLGTTYRGLSRVISVSRDGKTWPMWIGIGFLLLCAFSIYPAAFMAFHRHAHPVTQWGALGWAAAAIAHAITMTWQLGLTYAWSKNRWYYALLFPLGTAISLAIYCRALKQCLTGKFEWRGVSYALKSTAAKPK